MRRQGYLRPELGWEPPKSFPMSWKPSPSPRLLPVVQAWCLVEVKDHGADEQQDEPLHATLITVHYKGTRIPWKNPNLMKVLFSRVTVHYRPRCAVKTPKVENKKKKKKGKCRAAGCVTKSLWGWTFTILLYFCRREDATCSES